MILAVNHIICTAPDKREVGSSSLPSSPWKNRDSSRLRVRVGAAAGVELGCAEDGVLGVNGCHLGSERAKGRPGWQTTSEEGKKVRNGGCGLSRERGFRRGKALQAARGAETETLAHQEPEVEGGRVDEHSFANVLLAPNVEAAHAAGLKQVRERPLHLLPAAA